MDGEEYGFSSGTQSCVEEWEIQKVRAESVLEEVIEEVQEVEMLKGEEVRFNHCF